MHAKDILESLDDFYQNLKQRQEKTILQTHTSVPISFLSLIHRLWGTNVSYEKREFLSNVFSGLRSNILSSIGENPRLFYTIVEKRFPSYFKASQNPDRPDRKDYYIDITIDDVERAFSSS